MIYLEPIAPTPEYPRETVYGTTMAKDLAICERGMMDLETMCAHDPELMTIVNAIKEHTGISNEESLLLCGFLTVECELKPCAKSYWGWRIVYFLNSGGFVVV